MRTSAVLKALLLGTTAASFIACGPSPRQRPTGDDDDTGIDATNMPCQVTPEADPVTCADGIDNDCDGLTDCSDQNCSGVGECPICGMVDTPLAQPLALPDGIGGTSCSTDADCAAVQPGPQHCFDLITTSSECRQSYDSPLNFIGFGVNQTFSDPSNILSVCVNMEHSWMRDIEIALIAPDGKKVRMQAFEGQTGGEIYLGQANDSDSSNSPVPGVGADYCWKPTATNLPDIDYANSGGTMLSYNGHEELPPGDYQASDPWTNLVGAPLNGDWHLVVTDLWGIDNGYMFSWSITWDPNLVSDCSGPIVGRTGPQ
jgi:hypothetical protein